MNTMKTKPLHDRSSGQSILAGLPYDQYHSSIFHRYFPQHDDVCFGYCPVLHYLLGYHTKHNASPPPTEILGIETPVAGVRFTDKVCSG